MIELLLALVILSRLDHEPSNLIPIHLDLLRRRLELADHENGEGKYDRIQEGVMPEIDKGLVKRHRFISDSIVDFEMTKPSFGLYGPIYCKNVA